MYMKVNELNIDIFIKKVKNWLFKAACFFIVISAVSVKSLLLIAFSIFFILLYSSEAYYSHGHSLTYGY